MTADDTIRIIATQTTHAPQALDALKDSLLRVAAALQDDGHDEAAESIFAERSRVHIPEARMDLESVLDMLTQAEGSAWFEASIALHALRLYADILARDEFETDQDDQDDETQGDPR